MNSDDCRLPLYSVRYHTAPTPGCPFYQGAKEIYAHDINSAKQSVHSELAKKSGRGWSGIVIDGCDLLVNGTGEYDYERDDQ